MIGNEELLLMEIRLLNQQQQQQQYCENVFIETKIVFPPVYSGKLKSAITGL